MSARQFGFIGLGRMGAPMVANMLAAGIDVIAHDKAGTAQRAPAGAEIAESIAEVARQVDAIFICVPDGTASEEVVDLVTGTRECSVSTIINLSTTGIAAADAIATRLTGHGIDYIDAPVSGGRAGAVAGTITIMWSGTKPLLEALRPVLATFSKSAFFIGSKPGQGQALKLINNFLSAMAMTATSEAMIFGESKGLDMKTMLDVINVSTGQNTATSDKFPNRVVTGSFDAGFRMALMEKDVALYLTELKTAGTADRLARALAEYWREGVEAFPDGDFTEIFKLVKDRVV